MDDLFEDIPSRMTATEFLEFTQQTDRLYQLLNGRPMMNPAPRLEHQEIVGNIHVPLTLFVKPRALGKIWLAPADVVFDRFNVVQPDLFFVATDRLDIAAGGKLQGAPDFVVKVLSASTADVDRGYKQHLYALNGVREYWIIDPDAYEVEVLTLAEGEFGRVGVYRQGDTVISSLLTGFRITVDDIFAGV
jgi:Uma2 family endonuclease